MGLCKCGLVYDEIYKYWDELVEDFNLQFEVIYPSQRNKAVKTTSTSNSTTNDTNDMIVKLPFNLKTTMDINIQNTLHQPSLTQYNQ